MAETKACIDCGKTQPVEKFPSHGTGRRKGRCYSCITAKQKKSVDVDLSDLECATLETPTLAMPGYRIKGESVLLDGDGKVSAKWIKTSTDDVDRDAQLRAAVATIADDWPSLAPVVDIPLDLDEDLLAVYPMGDPHLGMFSWRMETGQDFDLTIAENNLMMAVDHLVAGAPWAKQALILNLGDFFHTDSNAGTTTAGTKQDTDTRWAKVLSVGVRVMRRLIDQALTKHETVHVYCLIGNHDSHTSIMLSLCLAQYYENEPRVLVDTSPDQFRKFRFGQNLIGMTHGDTLKADKLPSVMACDWAKDWGETTERIWYCGHVHHDTMKEYPGVCVETFRTLAPRDKWHHASGYRSGQDMKCDVFHARWGRVSRNTVGILQVQALTKDAK